MKKNLLNANVWYTQRLPFRLANVDVGQSSAASTLVRWMVNVREVRHGVHTHVQADIIEGLWVDVREARGERRYLASEEQVAIVQNGQWDVWIEFLFFYFMSALLQRPTIGELLGAASDGMVRHQKIVYLFVVHCAE